jgi:hypothetical protein
MALVAFAALASAALPAEAPRRCTHTGRTLARTSYLRVFKYDPPRTTPAIYACRLASERTQRLSWSSAAGPALVAARGVYVALELPPNPEPGRPYSVPGEVLRLFRVGLRGKAIGRYYDPGPTSPPPDPYPNFPIPLGLRGLVLTSEGRAAFVSANRYPDGTVSYDVVRCDYAPQHVPHDAPETTLLDSGVDVDPRSLRLSGTHVTWVRGGETRSASI